MSDKWGGRLLSNERYFRVKSTFREFLKLPKRGILLKLLRPKTKPQSEVLRNMLKMRVK